MIDVEKIWSQGFYHELRINPENTNLNVLQANSVLNNSKVSQIAEMAFENFKIGNGINNRSRIHYISTYFST